MWAGQGKSSVLPLPSPPHILFPISFNPKTISSSHSLPVLNSLFPAYSSFLPEARAEQAIQAQGCRGRCITRHALPRHAPQRHAGQTVQKALALEQHQSREYQVAIPILAGPTPLSRSCAAAQRLAELHQGSRTPQRLGAGARCSSPTRRCHYVESASYSGGWVPGELTRTSWCRVQL